MTITRFQLTLKDPLGALDPISLDVRPDDGSYDRAMISSKVDRTNLPGRPVVIGLYYGYRYLWTVSVAGSEEKIGDLQQFFLLQYDRGYLTLEDTVLYTVPEATPRKTLISGSEVTRNGATKGLGRFAVWMEISDSGSPKLIGTDSTVFFNAMQISLHEIPGVVP